MTRVMTKLDNTLVKEIIPVAPESLIGDLIPRDDPSLRDCVD